jgi:hypothetical protein
MDQNGILSMIYALMFFLMMMAIPVLVVIWIVGFILKQFRRGVSRLR